MQPSGALSSVTDSPYHGDYITGSRSFVSPNQTYVVDDSGTIYFVSNLTFAGGLGGKFDDLAFTSAGDPVVLRSERFMSTTQSSTRPAASRPARPPFASSCRATTSTCSAIRLPAAALPNRA